MFASINLRLEEKRELGRFFDKSTKAKGIVQEVSIVVANYLKSIGKELDNELFDKLILVMSRDIGIK